jgi:hypothetical protein
VSFLELCENIEDSRTDINKHYELLDIILTLSAVLSGAKGFKALHIFGDAQRHWLREYREFANGIPNSALNWPVYPGHKSRKFD